MKPRNEYQRNIVKMSEQLPPLTDKQRQWAIDHCFHDDAYYTAGKVWCLHCGEIFNHKAPKLGVEIGEAVTTCPNCNHELKLKSSRKCKYNERVYFTILTTSKGFQVCRHFLAEKYVHKTNHYKYAEKQPTFYINECVQNWIDENGKETIIARSVRCMPFYYDAWDFSKPMSIKSKTSMYAPNRYDIHTEYVYPASRVIPKILRNGFKKRYKNISHSEQAKLLLTSKQAEILAKNKQWDLFRHMWSRGYTELTFWHSVKVAIRHKYIVQDASMWLDYLGMLQIFGKDTHNPHYVCPQNLQVEHDRWMERKAKLDAENARKAKMEKARQWEADYQKNKGKYFDICFGNEDIIVSVIQSVADMAEEGQSMHHCVFDSGYYAKPESLILSARDTAGNRIETIEVDLNTYKVVQSRGLCNKNTKHHDVIIELVNNNMNLIRKAI